MKTVRSASWRLTISSRQRASTPPSSVPFNPQRPGHVVKRASRFELIDEPEPLLRERQGQRPIARRGQEGRSGRDRAGPAHRLDPEGEVHQPWGREKVAQRHFDAQGGAQARHHLGRQQRVPPQVEEVIGHPDPFETEHLGPDAGEDLFDRRARRHDTPH